MGLGVWEGHIFLQFYSYFNFILAIQQESVSVNKAEYMAMQK